MSCKNTTNICIFGGSKKGDEEIFKKKTIELVKKILKNKCSIIFGGGNLGLMGAVAETAFLERGTITTIIPKQLNKKNLIFKEVSKKIISKNFHQRKEEMVKRADFFILLPGGIGTLDEFFEVIALNQLKLLNKPILVLNINGFWNPLKDLLRHIKNKNFSNGTAQINCYFMRSVNKIVEFINSKM